METFNVTGIVYEGNADGVFLLTEMAVTVDTRECSCYGDIIALIAKFIFDAMSFAPVEMEIA